MNLQTKHIHHKNIDCHQLEFSDKGLIKVSKIRIKFTIISRKSRHMKRWRYEHSH